MQMEVCVQNAAAQLLGFFMYIWVFMCLRVSFRVVAENDFLHSLLNKVTTLRGDCGGQGTVLHSQA